MWNEYTSSAWILLLSLILALSVACSRNSSQDDQIAKDIQEKVAADEETKDSQVNVTSTNGKVTLTGKVKTPTAKVKLQQIAHEQPGATQVNDQTAVEQEALASGMAAAPPPAPKPKPVPQPIIVPAGTVLTVTIDQALSSKSAKAGQIFLATLAQPISVRGRPALPKGATASGTVISAKAKGKLKGQGELSIALTSISVGGHTYDIETDVLSSTVKGKGKRTAATTTGGAGGGALIGGIAGGGKGAAIGALVGATAGFIGGAATGNKQIEIPAEAALSFTMNSPLTLPPPSN